MQACAKLKSGLESLSAERIWVEITKLLQANNPSQSLLWARLTGVLGKVLPETEKWGIDLIHPLIDIEQKQHWPIDPLLRLMALIPTNQQSINKLIERLKLSNKDGDRLKFWQKVFFFDHEIELQEFKKIIYLGNKQAIIDFLKLAIVKTKLKNGIKANNEYYNYLELLKYAINFKSPEFPISGNDLLALDIKQDKKLGNIMGKLEELWINSDFKKSRSELLSEVKKED